MVIKNRSRAEIIYDIIAHADPSARKTHLMYGANLSFGMLDIYLDYIISIGLLEEKQLEGGRLFSTTEKGKRFIAVFDEMKSLFDSGKVDEAQLGKPSGAIIGQKQLEEDDDDGGIKPQQSESSESSNRPYPPSSPLTRIGSV